MVTLFETLLILLPFLLPVCLAQTQPQHSFNWAFSDPSQGLNVEQCQTVILKTALLSNGSENSVPPYTVASFEVDGIPDWQYNVSTDKTNIPWTVRHNVGTCFSPHHELADINDFAGAQLLLTLVDSLGNDAGIPQTITVLRNYPACLSHQPCLIPSTAGSNTTCLLPVASSPPVISNVNVTGGASLSTCGLWGMSVSGGTPPYGAFIVATEGTIFTPFNSSSLTNRLTYKNRAPPNNQMIGSSPAIYHLVPVAHITASRCPGL